MATADTAVFIPAQSSTALQSVGQAADTQGMSIDTLPAGWLDPDPGFFRAHCGEHIPDEHETEHYRECTECALELARFGEVA